MTRSAPLLCAALLSVAGRTSDSRRPPAVPGEQHSSGDQSPEAALPAPGLRTRVRSEDAALAALLREGHRRSETFRRLIAEIDATDGIVYVVRGRCPLRGMRGCLPHFVNRAGEARYLFVIVDEALDDDTAVIALIGHELRHAVEILEEPWIARSDDVFTHYQLRESRQATAGMGRIFETAAAQRAGEAIAVELARTPTAADDR